LRRSPQRHVLHLPGASPWLLKIYHPARPFPRLRRLCGVPAAGREARNLERLAARLPGLPRPAAVEQVRPSLGLLARPWLEGTLLAEAFPARARETGRALAHLHALGWCDPDLLPGDLLIPPENLREPFRLLPLDLGQARIGAGPAPPLARRRDLLLLLSTLDPAGGEDAAARLRDGYCELLPLEDSGADLAREARRLRGVLFWRQSARCLRSSADFAAESGRVRRREAPRPGPEQETLSQGRRSRVVRLGPVVRKEYRRAFPVLRNILGRTPARRGYRHLHLLELHGLPAARPLGWSFAGGRETLETGSVAGRPARPGDLAAVAGWLGRLHAAGLGLRDAKCANFVLETDGRPVLTDPDGLARRLSPRRRARDLGRLLAEASGEPVLERAALEAFNRGARPLAPLPSPAVLRQARRFRTILSAPRTRPASPDNS